MNFTQTILRKSVFSDHNKTLGNNEFPGMVSIATQRIPTSSIHVTSKVDEARTDSAWGWPSNFLGAFYGVVVVLIVIITCWLAREEHLRRKKGLDRTGRYYIFCFMMFIYHFLKPRLAHTHLTRVKSYER